MESFDPTKLTLQNLQSNPTAAHALTGGTKSEVSATELELRLTLADLNAVKAAAALAVDASSTFLSGGAGFVTDAANQAVGVVEGAPVATNGYVRNDRAPQLSVAHATLRPRSPLRSPTQRCAPFIAAQVHDHVTA